jgi:DNA-binding response OmpR family regulator
MEFKLLGVLVKEPGKVFSRAELIEKAMGNNFEGYNRTVDVHIVNIHRKLEPDPRNPRYKNGLRGRIQIYIGKDE